LTKKHRIIIINLDVLNDWKQKKDRTVNGLHVQQFSISYYRNVCDR